MLELPPLLPAVHLSFSAGTSIPVSNSFCHFPSKKAALVSVVPPPYLNMTHMNAGHGNRAVTRSMGGFTQFWKEKISAGGSFRQDKSNKSILS